MLSPKREEKQRLILCSAQKKVANGDININVDRFGRVSSASSSAYTGAIPAMYKFPKFSALNAIQSFASYLKVQLY